MQLLSIFGRIFAPRALGHDPQGRDASSQRGNRGVKVRPIPLLDHVMRRLFGLLRVDLIVVVVILGLSRRLAFSV